MEEVTKTWVFSIAVSLSLISISTQADSPYSQECSPLMAATQKHCWFLGASVGSSSIKPVPDEDSLWRVEKSSATSVKLYLGLSFSDHIFSEFSYENLGAAKLSNLNPNVAVNAKSISYQALSANAGYWLRGREQAWDVFAKVGLAKLMTDEQKSVSYQDHSSQLLLGIGAELRFANQWVSRVEFTSYDQDASAISIGVSRHLGPKPIVKPKEKVKFTTRPRVKLEPRPETKVEPKPVPKIDSKPRVTFIPKTETVKPTTVPVVEPKPVAMPTKPKLVAKPKVVKKELPPAKPPATEPIQEQSITPAKTPAKPDLILLPRASDRDGDGIRNSQDRCPKTPPNTDVDGRGCTVLKTITMNILFDANRAVVKDQYIEEIDKVSDVIKSLGSVFVTVEAHNDSSNAEADNHLIAELRAAVVADMIIVKSGINAENVSMRGYSESVQDPKALVKSKTSKQRVIVIVAEKP